jgi:hypothetical protein
MNVHGHICTTIHIHGVPYISMDIHKYPCISMDKRNSEKKRYALEVLQALEK